MMNIIKRRIVITIITTVIILGFSFGPLSPVRADDPETSIDLGSGMVYYPAPDHSYNPEIEDFGAASGEVEDKAFEDTHPEDKYVENDLSLTAHPRYVDAEDDGTSYIYIAITGTGYGETDFYYESGSGISYSWDPYQVELSIQHKQENVDAYLGVRTEKNIGINTCGEEEEGDDYEPTQGDLALEAAGFVPYIGDYIDMTNFAQTTYEVIDNEGEGKNNAAEQVDCGDSGYDAEVGQVWNIEEIDEDFYDDGIAFTFGTEVLWEIDGEEDNLHEELEIEATIKNRQEQNPPGVPPDVSFEDGAEASVEIPIRNAEPEVDEFEVEDEPISLSVGDPISPEINFGFNNKAGCTEAQYEAKLEYRLDNMRSYETIDTYDVTIDENDLDDVEIDWRLKEPPDELDLKMTLTAEDEYGGWEKIEEENTDIVICYDKTKPEIQEFGIEEPIEYDGSTIIPQINFEFSNQGYCTDVEYDTELKYSFDYMDDNYVLLDTYTFTINDHSINDIDIDLDTGEYPPKEIDMKITLTASEEYGGWEVTDTTSAEMSSTAKPEIQEFEVENGPLKSPGNALLPDINFEFDNIGDYDEIEYDAELAYWLQITGSTTSSDDEMMSSNYEIVDHYEFTTGHHHLDDVVIESEDDDWYPAHDQLVLKMTLTAEEEYGGWEVTEIVTVDVEILSNNEFPDWDTRYEDGDTISYSLSNNQGTYTVHESIEVDTVPENLKNCQDVQITVDWGDGSTSSNTLTAPEDDWEWNPYNSFTPGTWSVEITFGRDFRPWQETVNYVIEVEHSGFIPFGIFETDSIEMEEAIELNADEEDIWFYVSEDMTYLIDQTNEELKVYEVVETDEKR